MKISREISYTSGKSLVKIFSSGTYSAAIELSGRTIARIGGAKCNDFAEANGIAGKLRGHLTSDAIFGETEAVKIIPFGAEYRISRNYSLAGQVLKVACDVESMIRGNLHTLELDPLEFPGEWTGGWVYDGKKTHKLKLDAEVMYQSTLPPLLFRLTNANGVMVEYACGADYWRHSGKNSDFRLVKSEIGITFRRTIFQVPIEEAQPERKSWRFKYLISWKAPSRAKKAKDNTPLTSLPDVGESCLASPALQRALKKLVRRSAASLALGEVDPILCPDAAHQERPGKGELLHFPLEDMVMIYWWASRHFARENPGTIFVWRFSGKSPFPGGAFEHNLGVAPGILEKSETL